MEQRHVIETATFDLALDGALDVVRIDGELSRVVQAELLPVVEQVFDEIGAGTQSIRFDVLEVDVGTLGFAGSWVQARERFGRALRTALAQARSEAKEPHVGAPSSGHTAGEAAPGDACPRVAQALGDAALQSEHSAQRLRGGDADLADASLSVDTSSGDSLFRGYALYEALWGRVLGQGARGGSGVESLEVEALVAALVAEHPQQLQRLYRELQSATVPAASALASLSGAGLRALVRGILSLTTPGVTVQSPFHKSPLPLGERARERGQTAWGTERLPPGEAATPSQFMQAIESFAARAGSARRYYGEVLAHLVRDELVDLEAIAAGAQAEEQPETGPKVVTAAADGPPTPPMADADAVMTADAAVAPGEALAGYRRDGTLAPGVEAAMLVRGAEGMLVHEPGRLRRLLEEVLVDEASVGRLVALLPERALAQVLFVLAPQVYGALQGVADTLAIAAHGPESGIPGARVSELKWRFAIRYLLQGGGRTPEGMFDEAAFVRGFTAALSRQSSLGDATALGEALARQLALNVLPVARDLQLRVLQVLRATAARAPTDLGDAATAAATSAPDPGAPVAGDGAHAGVAPPSGGEPLFRGYALYEALRGRLLGQGARGGSGVESLEVEALVAALLAEHPQQLQRLYRELQSATVPVASALASLSGAGLRALVRGILSLTTPGEAGTPSQFMQAIESFAARASSARRYYGEVLAHLVRDELVDLEAIAAGAQAEPEPESGAEVVLQAADGPPTPPMADADAVMTADAAVGLGEALAGYLRDGTLAPGVEAAMLVRGAEGMLVHEPGRLRRLLQEVLVDESSVGRLVALLPERALARVLFVLAPQVYAALQGVADTLAIAAHGPESGIPGARVSDLKWRFAIRYLLQGGGQQPEGVFDEAAFVRGFTAALSRQSSLGDATALGEALARQLALNVLPVARDMQLRVLQALRAAAARAPSDLGDAVTAAATAAPDPGTPAAGDGAHAGVAPPPGGEPLFRGYALYEALRGRLLGQGARGGNGMASLEVEALVAALLAAHPQQLQRLYRELQSATVPVASALASLSGAGLRALVRGILSLTTPGVTVQSPFHKSPLPLGERARERAQTGWGTERLPPAEAATPSQFMQAIERFAARAGSARRYYGEVLAHLVRDEWVDLEAIAAGAQAEPEPESGADLVSQAAEGPPTPHTADTDAGVEADAAVAPAEALAGYLRDGTLAPGVQAAMLVRGAEGMLVHEPVRLGRLLQEVLVDEASVGRLVALLPERTLARVLFVLAPGVYAALQGVADTLAIAAHGPESGIPGARVSELKWRFAIRYLLQGSGRTPEGLFDEAAFVRGFTAALSRESSLGDVTALGAALARQLALNVLPVARDMQLRVLQALRAAAATPGPSLATSAATIEGTRDDLEERRPRDEAESIRIANAGQVLASPYLPLLFERLALTERGAFTSRDAAERAARLLQFMVDGSTEPPQQPLVLNRILCGLSGPPPEACVRLRPEELAAVESLLQAMIAHWTIIGNTTVAGLRESFMQREGVLVSGADGWRLTVAPRAYDMLLDRLPWSFSMIKHPWMERLLQVAWR